MQIASPQSVSSQTESFGLFVRKQKTARKFWDEGLRSGEEGVAKSSFVVKFGLALLSVSNSGHRMTTLDYTYNNLP